MEVGLRRYLSFGPPAAIILFFPYTPSPRPSIGGYCLNTTRKSGQSVIAILGRPSCWFHVLVLQSEGTGVNMLINQGTQFCTKWLSLFRASTCLGTRSLRMLKQLYKLEGPWRECSAQWNDLEFRAVKSRIPRHKTVCWVRGYVKWREIHHHE